MQLAYASHAQMVYSNCMIGERFYSLGRSFRLTLFMQ
jgi:hypothetical protein